MMKKLTIGIVATASCALLVGGLSAPAMALGAHPASHSAQTVAVAPQYSDVEVVSLLLFGTGAIQADHPGLAQKMGFVPRVHANAATITKITTVLTDVDSGFHAKVTEAVQSGNPYTAEAGLNRFEADLMKLVPAKDEVGNATGDCAVDVIVALTELAVAGANAVYNENALWNTNTFWLAADGQGPSTFSQQANGALLAGAL
jgi:SdpC family antimicrobial peptide